MGLAALEARITAQTARLDGARAALQSADRNLVAFKRERAKITAEYLYLGNRKYEAPNLTKDYEAWCPGEVQLLNPAELDAARDIRRKAEPTPKLSVLTFDADSVAKAFAFVSEMCSQSLTAVALEEAQRFPEMLMWLTQGHSFHARRELETCLLCGNPLSKERMRLLTLALDDKIDQFIAKLSRTSERLQQVDSSLAVLEEALPSGEMVDVPLRNGLKEAREGLVRGIRRARRNLANLLHAVTEKQKQPASRIDGSQLPDASEIAATVETMTHALAFINSIIIEHNRAVESFAALKSRAELDIRKHFIAECHEDYAAHTEARGEAKADLDKIESSLTKYISDAEAIRQKINKHGAAASAINSLVASYLGHEELQIHPVEGGYELRRHGEAIRGLPSEGEKTAIAIAYFISSIEAEGRKLKDTIVVVDDPVSSLDTKALNFACTLVQSRLEGAGQLFVLTHNLQCMNEFKKAWKRRARRMEDNSGRQPTAAFYFIDVKMLPAQRKRSASLVEMSKLLREYDSEYHYLFGQVLNFLQNSGSYPEYGYLMPHILRRVLDVFLAFRCPGSSGLSGQISKLCADHANLDKDRLIALERLAQVESHSDNLDDLLGFSSMTLEESKAAAVALLGMMEAVDSSHLQALKRLCA